MERIVIPACEGRGVRVPAGSRFRVVDVEGQQCVDLFVLSADDVTEYVSPDHTRVELYRMFPRVGQHFFTNRRREILLFEEDGSPGVHDMLIAACDPARYARLGVQGWHPSCQENFLKVVRELGLDYRRNEESGHVNLFTNIAIREDGSMDWLPAPSKAGDYVVMRAEMDCYVIVVACAQDILPINAHKPSSLALEILD